MSPSALTEIESPVLTLMSVGVHVCADETGIVTGSPAAWARATEAGPMANVSAIPAIRNPRRTPARAVPLRPSLAVECGLRLGMMPFESLVIGRMSSPLRE
jgi:hypothetical protein